MAWNTDFQLQSVATTPTYAQQTQGFEWEHQELCSAYNAWPGSYPEDFTYKGTSADVTKTWTVAHQAGVEQVANGPAILVRWKVQVF